MKKCALIFTLVFISVLHISCSSRNHLNVEFEDNLSDNIFNTDIEKYISDNQLIYDTDTDTEIIIPIVINIFSGPEGFPDLLSWFITAYDPGDINRTENLHLAGSRINNRVVQPNQVFSFGIAISPITEASGYKYGIIYSGGRRVPGLAGGVCQVLSTLYNAVLYSNMEITERYPHQFMVNYLDNPRDATLFFPGKDFKFRNNRKNPIMIKSKVENGIIVVDIFGTKEPDDYEVELYTQIINTVPFRTTTVYDDSLPKGETIIEVPGVNGGTAELYVILKKDGNVVSRTLRSRDTYIPHPQTIRIGTRE